MQKLFILSLLVSNIFLVGCGFLKARPTVAEYDGISVFDGISEEYPLDAKAFAFQASLELNNRYPTGKTEFQLIQTDKNQVFIQSIEEHLRQLGYSVNTTGVPRGLLIAYILDSIVDENKAYLQIQISDGTRFGFVRTLGTTGELYKNPPYSSLESKTKEKVYGIGSTILNTAQTTDSIKAPNNASTFATVNVLRLKLRTDPSTESRQLTSLLQGERLTILDKSNNQKSIGGRTNYWYQVQTKDNLIGWVFGAFIDLDKLETHTTPDVIVPDVPDTFEQLPIHTISAHNKQSELSEFAENYSAIPYEKNFIKSTPLWHMQKGSLMHQLEDFAKEEGWTLIWNADFDLDMKADASFTGTFVEFMEQLFSALQNRKSGLRISIYKTNNVLEVSGD